MRYTAEEIEAIFNELRKMVVAHKLWLDGFMKRI